MGACLCARIMGLVDWLIAWLLVWLIGWRSLIGCLLGQFGLIDCLMLRAWLVDYGFVGDSCLLHVLQGGYLWVSWCCVRRHRGRNTRPSGAGQGGRTAGGERACLSQSFGDITWYWMVLYYSQHNADPVASHKYMHSWGFSDAVATIQCTTSVVWRCLKRRS